MSGYWREVQIEDSNLSRTKGAGRLSDRSTRCPPCAPARQLRVQGTRWCRRHPTNGAGCWQPLTMAEKMHTAIQHTIPKGRETHRARLRGRGIEGTRSKSLSPAHDVKA